MSAQPPSEEAIKSASAPWTCKCDSYWLMFILKGPLPDHAYSPLEASSAAFSDPEEAGEFKGSLGSVQIVRYSDTPAGSYDEMVLVPGYFAAPGQRKSNLRVTRIYVSQKVTCYNGRKNWGIPKHLARFSFTRSPSGSLTVEVFPPDTTTSRPFFTAQLHPFRWLPALPFSTSILPYVGLDTHLVQPPLLASEEQGQEELAGTTQWLKTLPLLHTKSARGMWVQFKREQAGKGAQSGEADPLLSADAGLQRWWPELNPWKIGMWLENATLVFAEPEVLG